MFEVIRFHYKRYMFTSISRVTISSVNFHYCVNTVYMTALLFQFFDIDRKTVNLSLVNNRSYQNKTSNRIWQSEFLCFEYFDKKGLKIPKR